MKAGDILGHEFLGEVVELGRGVNNLQMGDRVIVLFPIACGNCYYWCARIIFFLRQQPSGPRPKRVGKRRRGPESATPQDLV